MERPFTKSLCAVIVCGFLLAACVPAGQPTIPESLTATPQATETATPTCTPTATTTHPPSPTPEPTLPPTTGIPAPALPGSMGTSFLLGGNSPDCQLPCWNGLVIGESDTEDI